MYILLIKYILIIRHKLCFLNVFNNNVYKNSFHLNKLV